MSTNNKCHYYNRGFCGKHDNCTYTHLNEDCKNDCMDSLCPFRHRVTCKNGSLCHYNKQGICQFKHQQEGEENTKIQKKQKILQENTKLIEENMMLQNNILFFQKQMEEMAEKY